jgi:hypothetical protein
MLSTFITSYFVQESLELQQRQAEAARQAQLEAAAGRLRAAQPAVRVQEQLGGAQVRPESFSFSLQLPAPYLS